MQAEQAKEINHYLKQAQQEAASYNWLEVNYYLQQSPIFATKLSFSEIEPENQEQILQLAIDVLINGDFQQKWQIAKLFPVIGNYGINALIALLDKETIDYETKWFIARILGDFPQQKVIIALANLLQTTSESDLTAIAAESLAKIGIPAVETLIQLLETEYRLLAAKALAYIRVPSVIPTLLALATDNAPEIRVLAIEALGSFHAKQILPVLIQALQDRNSMVRKEAVIALGFCRDLYSELNLVSHLQPLLYDLNLDVCRQTALSLGKIGNDSATEALNGALKSPNTPLSLKLDIVKALAWSESSLALDYLQAAITTESNLVSQEIITVLGRIKTIALKSKAIAILANFWQTSPLAQDFECKKSLAMAFGELKAQSSKGILEQLAQDENKMVQLYAIASLKKIDS